jgi:hypothetical protein
MIYAIAFFKKYPVSVYFTLAFTISWGAIVIMVGPDGIPVPVDQRVAIGVAMLLGPSLAGILSTAMISGSAVPITFYRISFRRVRIFKVRLKIPNLNFALIKKIKKYLRNRMVSLIFATKWFHKQLSY